MDLVDAHIHLPAYPNPEAVISAARSFRTQLISCTVNLAEAATNLKLRQENSDVVRCFLGVHPSDAAAGLAGPSISELLASADGIGEIGLDPKYSDTSAGSPQMKAFLGQLTLAEKLDKPVEVHSRGAEEACLDVLSSYKLRHVLMHWFESEQHLDKVISKGYYASVGPALLYSKRLQRVASRLPVDRLLTESDGPVPYSALGGTSGPSLIPSVLFQLSAEKHATFDEMVLTVNANAGRFLGLPS